MSERIFNILQGGGLRMTKTLDSGVTTAYNGYLLQVGTDGEFELHADKFKKPDAVLYDSLALEELPTTNDVGSLRAGERVAGATGEMVVQISRLLVSGTQLPAKGAKLYSAGDGTYTTTNTGGSATLVGHVLDYADVQNDADLGNTYQQTFTAHLYL